MIDINLESMKDVSIKEIMGNCVIELIGSTGAKITITTTIENGAAIHEALENVAIENCYRYEEMQKENDRLNEDNENLREENDNLRCCESAAVEGF